MNVSSSYQLVLDNAKTNDKETSGVRGAGTVYLRNLPTKYDVYLFYYSGPIRNDELEKKLISFGEEAGNNLFVNIGSLRDPEYKIAVSDFGIREFPVIIMTAADDLALVETEKRFATAYVRLDNKRLLEDTDKVIRAVGKLFNLFISEQISESIKEAGHQQRNAVLSHIQKVVSNRLNEIWDTLKEKDITISVLEGKLEIKERGGV